MNKPLSNVATALMFAGAILIPCNSSAYASPAPAPSGAQALKGAKYQHPEIEAAINHLQEAKVALERGAHDFGGHRAMALEETNKALKECREALRFANEHRR